MAFTAIELGHEYLVLTDHSPRLTVAHGLSAERLTRQLDVVDAVNDAPRAAAGFTLLKGIEVDILDDGALDQTDELLARLDVRVASVHSKLKMDAGRDDPADDRARSATRAPTCSATAPAGWSPATAAPGRAASSTREAVFEACAEHDVAVEINSRPERRDPPTTLLELARDIGCLFSIDSDAHAPGQLDFLVYGCERAEAAGHRPRPDRQHLAAGPAAGLGESRPDSGYRAAMTARPRWRYAAPSGAVVRSRPTATATGSWC